jgi:hypothetical protein
MPNERAASRAQAYKGMDPEMASTLSQERRRKTKEKMMYAPDSLTPKKADFSGAKSGGSSTAPKKKKFLGLW